MKKNYRPIEEKITADIFGNRLHSQVKEFQEDGYAQIIKTRGLNTEYLIKGCYIKTREGRRNTAAYIHGFAEIHGHNLESIMEAIRVVQLLTGFKLEEVK